MTDDEKLAALFHDAAGTPPPSGFDHGDVTAASRRITVRRRAALATGAVVLVAAAGIGSVVALPRGADTATSTASGAAANAPAAPLADSAERAAGGPAAVSAPAPAAPPLGPGTGECANRQDPALRALVEQALPEVAGATAAATTDVCLPGTQRYVSLEVADGLLDVSYLPPGEAASLPVGNHLSAPTASGGTVIVGSTAVGGGPAPYASRLPELLGYLAGRL
jgi:hypothetical protein